MNREWRWILCGLVTGVFLGPPSHAGTKLEFKKQDVAANAPHAMLGAGFVHDRKRNRLIAYGDDPAQSNGQNKAMSLLAFDLKSNEWSRLQMNGAMPTANAKPGLAYVESEDALYLFGGWMGGADRPSADMWRINLASDGALAWEAIPKKDSWPPARNGMVLVADGPRNRLLLHGGDGGPHPQYGYTPLRDFWAFDLKRREWSRQFIDDNAPAARWNHSAAIDSTGEKLYVFGGAGYVLYPKPERVMDTDIFVLDLKTDQWSKMPKSKRTPRPVQGTTLTFDERANALVVVGGLTIDGGKVPGTRRVYAFDLQRKKWARSKEILTSKRRDHVTIYDPVGHRHLVFGGHSVVEEGNFYRAGKPFSDTISIEVQRVDKD